MAKREWFIGVVGALSGGFTALMWATLLGYDLSVAVWIGYTCIVAATAMVAIIDIDIHHGR